jgi:hypothetical protein
MAYDKRVLQAWVEDWEEEAQKKTTVFVRRNYLQSIKVLCSAIQTLGRCITFAIKIWSSKGGEDRDGT